MNSFGGDVSVLGLRKVSHATTRHTFEIQYYWDICDVHLSFP